MAETDEQAASIARAEAVEAQAVEILERASELVLGLSVDESDYDLDYLTERLAKCSSYQERLVEMATRLTLLEIPVLRVISSEEVEVDAYAAELMESETYRGLAASERARWVKGKIAGRRRAYSAWKSTKQALYEVKKAVSRRVETMRRLDSDLRLHAGILEAKLGHGAVPRDPDRFGEAPGWRGNERDITQPATGPSVNPEGEIDLE